MIQPGRSFRSSSGWRFSYRIALLAFVAPPENSSLAQIGAYGPSVADEAGPADEGADDPNTSFVLPSSGSGMRESLEDLARHTERQRWERAFQVLEKVGQAEKRGLIGAKGEIRVSPERFVQRYLSTLPPSGQAAYRLFHDGEAKSLLDAATGPDEEAKLQEVFTRFLLTSSGDQAANRLGDLYFERGEFGKAALCWRAILRDRPDSAIPAVTLWTKVGIAMARQGLSGEAEAALAELERRYAGVQVTLGGRQVDPIEHIRSLLGTSATTPGAHESTSSPVELTLHEPLTVAWQFQYTNNSQREQLQQVMRGRFGFVGNMASQTGFPDVALDDGMAYINYVGFVFGIDIHTGKLRWRTGKPSELTKQQNRYYVLRPDQYHLLLDGDRLWCISIEPDHLGQQQQFSLSCRKTEDGSAITLSAAGKLGNYNFLGLPLMDDDRLYATAYDTQQGNKVYMLAIRKSDGDLIWSTEIGTSKEQIQDYYNQMTVSRPGMLLRQGRLIVDTHLGAVLSLRTDTGEIEWGCPYSSPPQQPRYYYGQSPPRYAASAPFLHDGLVLTKGMRASEILAIDPAIPTIVWKRPVAPDTMIVAADTERLFLGGGEFMAIDWESRRLAWGARVPVGNTEGRPIIGKRSIYQFTPRGIFAIEKSTGDVQGIYRGADLESLGGSLYLRGDKLIAASDRAVTAYELNPPAEPRTTDAAESAR
jgi:outer membrane protein assembly factor BamB